ncbi:putative AC transposase [Pseudolycoriella hygida]|uniref:AC transposase n=1 Tax=Pseudolycoriella hygida TaxID=35572 RepID=A0A9Q0MYR7_9DIPT|nr:putative AC transposase [Pseudolycoriella hygida]
MRVLGVTTDNAYNMDTMFDELEKLFNEAGIIFESKNQRIRCIAHIMNLSCQAMIRYVGDGDTAEYPSDEEESDEEDESAKTKVLPVVAKLRKGVVAIRNSPQRREVLARQCIAADMEPKVVLKDVRTRWNATHTMMQRAKDLKHPFDLTLRSIPKLRQYVLDEVEWQKIDELLHLLAPCKEATEMLSNDHSPTVSRVSAVYQVLFDHLQQFKSVNSEPSEPSSKRMKRNTPNVPIKPPWLIEAAERGLEKLEKYYPTSDGLVYIVNTVLDPRCKLVWYKATGWPKDWIDYSRKAITELYKSKYKPKTANEDETTKTASTIEPKKHLFKDLFMHQMKNYQKSATDDELKTYLSESADPELLVKEKTGIDGVLGWWKEFPSLAKMAKDYLPAAGTGVPVERLFSSGPDVMSNKQQRMHPETIRMRVCLKAWLKSKNSFNDDILAAIAHKLGVDDGDANQLYASDA